MYKETISIEMQLKRLTIENPEYGELWSTWNLNKKTLEPILNAIIKDYPHYSLHDHSHSESILANIERVLGNGNIENLSPTDLWLLLHVAYLHDFGMVIVDIKIHELWSTPEFQEFLRVQQDSTNEDLKKAATIISSSNKSQETYDSSWPLEVKSAVTLLTSQYCRGKHAAYSRDYILDINNIWGIDLGHNGLIKHRFLSLLADISAIHTKPFEDLYKLHKEANGFKNDYVHPRLIASLLRVGDILDLDNGRFHSYGEKIFGKMPHDSKIHYEKHESTTHVLINNELIEVEADCQNDEIYRETRRWYDSLKNEIDNLHLNWSDIAPREFSHPPKLAPYKILREGIETPYDLSNLKFTISQNKVFEILEGSLIYKDKFACIREIVQNAEDATKIQLWRDIKSGMYYSPNGIDKTKVESGSLLPIDIPEWIYQIYSIQINVERNEDNNAIMSVIDHGTGISLDTLKSICNVGQSYFQEKKRKQEIDEMPVWLRPTASFGIGLQSCFLLTDKITIHTNSDEDGAYKLTFKSGKQEGYVNIEALEHPPARGSKVVLEINNDLNFSFNFFGFTARRIMEIEPFESNCIVLYKIIEAIFQECDSSLFEISVISKNIDFEENISATVSNKSGFPSELLEAGELYKLSQDNGEITCWYNNNLYKIAIDKKSRGKVAVKFKGKNVQKSKINTFRYQGFKIEVDIYGIATKEALNLSREELTYQASKKVEEDINHIIKTYLDLLEQNAKAIKENTNLVDTLLLSMWLYKKNFPDSLHTSVSGEKNIRAVSYDKVEKGYKAVNCSLSDIVGCFPEIPCINCEIRKLSSMHGQDLTEEEFINGLNSSNIDKSGCYQLIIIDDDLKRFLSHGPCDITYLEFRDNIWLYTARTDDRLYNPDKYTRQILIRNLVFDDTDDTRMISGNAMNSMRRAMPAFEEFSGLAVDLKYIPFIRAEGRSKWNIISPISLEDSKKIEGFSKEAFIDFIVSQTVFSNLVDYVAEHGKSKSSRETIISEYKHLIEAYYELETSSDRASTQ